MFHVNNQASFFQQPSLSCPFMAEPETTSNSSQNLCDIELQNKFAICRKNLLIFLGNINVKNDLRVILKVVRKYYKMPFDEFPEVHEIMNIFEKITQRISINKSQQKNWYQEDIMLLTWLVVKYSYFKLTDVKLFKDVDWTLIADIIPFKTAEQCKFKWLSLERLNLQEKPWTLEEDQILKSLVLENPNKKWTEIAKVLYQKADCVVYRAGKFCRERWNNYLTPDLKKGIWLINEDIDLMTKIMNIGKKWSEISRITPGRTENGVKNRFNSLAKKWLKKHNYPSSADEETIMSEIYKSLLETQKKAETDPKQNELEIALSRNQAITKKAIHLEDLKKKQQFNLLFELLKCDIGSPNIVQREKKKYSDAMKPNLTAVEKSVEKKTPYIKKEIVSLKTEEKDLFQNNPSRLNIDTNPALNLGMNLGMWPNFFAVNGGLTPWMMQQYMMNMMMQQTLNRNLMNTIIKQENNS